jgi:hypothetical protein
MLVSRMSDTRFKLIAFSTAVGLYLVGVWLHIPYGGGHIYSDIVSVFQTRECAQVCTLKIPYVQTFVEYPVLVAMFMYLMGILGSLLPGSLLLNYYYFTAAFLLIPTLLLIRELFKIIELRGGSSRQKVLLYFIVTPTFIYMVLVNWYIIGTYFAIFGIRRYLQGDSFGSGILLGLSAASNLITAAPALGLLVASQTMKQRVSLVLAGGLTYILLNAPFLILNSKLWFEAFRYVYNWYIEDSWLLIILPDNYSPLRHTIPLVIFGGIVAAMLWIRFRRGSSDPLLFAFISLFGYVFSSYIYTPQENVALLPFFVLIPIANSYWEFLTFDIANSLIIILGFSQALQPLGITYTFQAFDRYSLIWWIEVLRSLWVGKFTLFNGFPKIWSRGEAGIKGAEEPGGTEPPPSETERPQA